MNKNSEEMKALYEKSPYPQVLNAIQMQTVPMLIHWINAAVAPNGIALHPQATILSAGCGSGDEVFLLAKQFPEARITGLDFSATAIRIAREKAAALQLKNVVFETVDLTDDAWVSKDQCFDFIACHGVADFVDAPQKLLSNLSNCLSENGVLCITVNSPHHPADRIQAAYAQLWGRPNTAFEDSEPHRKGLEMITKLMGQTVGIEGIAKAPKAYLDVDIFPPFAQHLAATTWIDFAHQVKLNFAGTLDGPIALTQLEDKVMNLLYHFDRPSFSKWILALQNKPGTQLLFCKHTHAKIGFNSSQINNWMPKLQPILGQLPLMNCDPLEPRPVRLRFAGMPDLVLNTRAYDLEVLRQCDGQNMLKDIIKSIGLELSQTNLWTQLFRAYQYGLIS